MNLENLKKCLDPLVNQTLRNKGIICGVEGRVRNSGVLVAKADLMASVDSGDS